MAAFAARTEVGRAAVGRNSVSAYCAAPHALAIASGGIRRKSAIAPRHTRYRLRLAQYAPSGLLRPTWCR